MVEVIGCVKQEVSMSYYFNNHTMARLHKITTLKYAMNVQYSTG